MVNKVDNRIMIQKDLHKSGRNDIPQKYMPTPTLGLKNKVHNEQEQGGQV